ncbi:hypothetical protein [Streptomyces sp. NPDC001450]
MCVQRTRELVADGTVVSYERSYLPPVSVIRELPARGRGQDSLTEELLRAVLRPDHGERRVSTRPPRNPHACPGPHGVRERSTPGRLPARVAVRPPLPGDLPWKHPHTTTFRRRPSRRWTRWP